MSKLKIFCILSLMFFFTTKVPLYAQIIKDDFRVNDDTLGGESSSPVVEILESGEEMIVWVDERNNVENIYGQAYDSTGNALDSNFKASTNLSSVYEFDPAISSYGDSLLVIWAYGSVQWLLPDGSKESTTFHLETGSYEPDVAVSDSGFFVVWNNDFLTGDHEVYIMRFDFNGDSITKRMVINDDAGEEDQRRAHIAMNDSGYFVAVWEDERNGDCDIYGQLFNPSGDTIGGNFLINDDEVSAYQYNPYCAIDNAGNFVVVWWDERDANYHIYGQRFDSSGEPINSNFLIGSDRETSDQCFSSCAMDSAGNFVVVWMDYLTGEESVYGRIFDNAGNPVDSSFEIGQNASFYFDNFPEVSMNKSNFVVTWCKETNSSIDIYKRRFENDGTPVTGEIKVNATMGTADQKNPKVDMNTNGNVVLVWDDFRTSHEVYFQRLDTLGDTLGGNVLVGVGGSPDVAVSEDGSFFIAYNYTYNFSTYIYYQRFSSSGDSIGSPITVSDTADEARGASSIDFDLNNNAVVAWQDSRNGNEDIYAQMISPEGIPVGVNFKVNDDSGIAVQYRPDVAMSPSGNFLITWYDQRDGDYDIYGQIFDSDGNALGSNFRIDSGGTDNQHCPDAKYLPDGNFIVVWQDFRIPMGIYAQILDSTGIHVDTNFRVSDNTGYEPAVEVTLSGAFVVTWGDASSDLDIYAQKYSPDYSPDSTNFKVNNENEGPNTFQEDPCVATNGNIFFFAWEDPKWQMGYDIAAKVFGKLLSGIEDVTKEKKKDIILRISNPILTGKEWVILSLDRPTKVEFKIINVAGIVVSSKKIAYKTSGLKKAAFDVSQLSSGPYFLLFKTPEGIAIKKAMVIR